MTDFKMKYQIVADAAKAKAEVKSFDDLLKGAGASLGSSIGGPATIAAAGIAAMGAAGITAGVALFNLTKTAADYGSTIYDASQKTGLHAESLSAMDFAAKQSGTSLDSITGGIAKFAKTVGAAANDTKLATQFMKDFGITPQQAINDLDGSLDKVFKKIMAAPPGVERMTLAQKAFGKSGADLLPFLDSFGGDLGELRKKAKELGVTIDDETMRASDEFGDSLDTLSEQFAGVGRAIAGPFMKPFTEMAEGVSHFLSENHDEMSTWSDKTVTFIYGVSAAWSDLTDKIRQYTKQVESATGARLNSDPYNFSTYRGPNPVVEKYIGRPLAEYIKRRGEETRPLDSRALGQIGPGVAFASEGTGGGGGGGRKKIADKLPAFGSLKKLVISSGNAQWDSWFNQMGQKYGVDPNVLLLQAGAESSFKSGAVSPKGAQGFSQIMPGTAAQYGVDTSTVKGSITGQARIMADLLSRYGGDYSKALAGYNAGSGAVDKYGGVPPYRETRGYVSKIQSQYRGRVGNGKGGEFGTFDYDQKRAEDEKYESDLLDLASSTLNEWIADEKAASEDRLSIRQAESDQTAEIVQSQVDQGIVSEREGIQKLGELKLDALKAERKEIGDQISSKENINKLSVLDVKIQTQTIANARELAAYDHKRFEDLKAQNEERRKQAVIEAEKAAAAARHQYEQSTVLGGGGIGAGIGRSLGIELAPEFDAATNSLIDFDERLTLVGQDINNFVGGALGSMIDALGQMAIAWIVTGEGSAKAALQMVAGAALGIALESFLKGSFEIAEAAAAFARWDFVTGNAHMLAAGLYFKTSAIAGAIGGGAAIAGRAVGGGGSGGGRGGSSSGGGSGSGSGSGSGTREREVRPYSRESEDAFISGHRDSHIAALATAVDKLQKKIGGVSAGEILVAGSRQKRGFIGTQTVNDMKSMPQLGSTLMRRMGGR
jgi:hypothetical protein